MRRVTSLAVVLCAFIVSLSVSVLPAVSQNAQSVAAAAGRSVCIVLAEGGSGTTSGTGFVVADGFVLTAHHVVQSAEHLRVLCPDHPAIEVKLVNADADNDVALVQSPLLSIRPLPLGDSGKVQVGQAIVVIGFPRADLTAAEPATVTQGIVSSVRAGALQLQAPVGPGNSGSPVLTLQGQVVGVVRAVLGNQVGSNLATSFATGIDAAKPFLTAALGGLYGGVAVGNAPPVRPAPTPAPISSKFTITPGRSIGDVTLGMRRNELETQLGPPKHVTPTADGASMVNWYDRSDFAHGFGAVISSAGEVIMIGMATDSRYTVEGLHAGNTEIEVRAALGEPSRTELVTLDRYRVRVLKMLYYDSLGLEVDIVNDPSLAQSEQVAAFGVFRPGCVFSGFPRVLQSGTCK